MSGVREFLGKSPVFDGDASGRVELRGRPPLTPSYLKITNVGSRLSALISRRIRGRIRLYHLALPC